MRSQAKGSAEVSESTTVESFQLSDHLAAERTFLAWIRTGLALMGFGFVVARFGLFLQELQSIRPAGVVHSYGLSLWFGTGLICAGVVVDVYSSSRYSRLIGHMNASGSITRNRSITAIAIGLFLAFVGIAMAIYLIWV
ncbi:MAG: YidH family protein [Candidatus Acidiferrales bacterium]